MPLHLGPQGWISFLPASLSAALANSRRGRSYSGQTRQRDEETAVREEEKALPADVRLLTELQGHSKVGAGKRVACCADEALCWLHPNVHTCVYWPGIAQSGSS
eukprot:1145703-Pelagomonas_calceolata.AAC.3